MGVITNGGKTKPNMRREKTQKEYIYIFLKLITT